MDIVFDDVKGARRRLYIVARRPRLMLDVDGERLDLEELDCSDPLEVRIRVGERLLEGWRWVAGNDVYLHLGGRHWHFRRAGIEAGESAGGAVQSDVRADMPGTVVSVHVSAGDRVDEGDRLLTIESMKLQMILTASQAGCVMTVHVAENSTFDRGATLVSFEPEAGG